MSKPEFKDKFIGFVDILGFKRMVQEAESGAGMPLNKLLELLEAFGPNQRKRFEEHGPMICPASTYVERNLDFCLTRISDCMIVSTEISPAGVINLLNHCWGAAMTLLHSGTMCRGYVTRGKIFHSDSHLIGTGYQFAYENEENVAAFKRVADEHGTPFIEVDPAICEFVGACDNACVKEMFSRMVESDGKATALFPFKRLSHSFIVARPGYQFDPAKEKAANQTMRLILHKLKASVMGLVDRSNPRAVQKAEHYIQALDEQLVGCDKTDEFIASFGSAFPPISGRRKE